MSAPPDSASFLAGFDAGENVGRMFGEIAGWAAGYAEGRADEGAERDARDDREREDAHRAHARRLASLEPFDELCERRGEHDRAERQRQILRDRGVVR